MVRGLFVWAVTRIRSILDAIVIGINRHRFPVVRHCFSGSDIGLTSV